MCLTLCFNNYGFLLKTKILYNKIKKFFYNFYCNANLVAESFKSNFLPFRVQLKKFVPGPETNTGTYTIKQDLYTEHIGRPEN